MLHYSNTVASNTWAGLLVMPLFVCDIALRNYTTTIKCCSKLICNVENLCVLIEKLLSSFKHDAWENNQNIGCDCM